MKSILCFSVAIIIYSILAYISPVSSGRHSKMLTSIMNNPISALCKNTSNPETLAKVGVCINSSLDNRVRSAVATCMTSMNKTAQNPAEVLPVFCDVKSIGRVTQCIKSNLQNSSISAVSADKQMRKAVTGFGKCIQRQKK